MRSYDIGIVIVNYNVRHFLEQCIQSIRHSQINGLNISVWVVDNASVDGSVALLKNEYPEVHLIANDKNVGFSAANNQAIRIIDANYILLLNPDTVLQEDTLYKCYHFMESKQDAGAVGVRMIDGAGKFLPESKRKIPDVWNSFCKLTYLSDLFPNSRTFSGYNLGYLPENQTNEVEILCGAFMFIRSKVLQEIGLLDEAFFMYGEDIDLSYRILKARYKIWYYPETSIIHYKGESTKKSSFNYVRTFYGAMHIYVNKHYSKGSADFFTIVIKWAISVRALLSGMARLLKNWLLPILDALMIWLLLMFIKQKWALFYFHDDSYYANTSFDLILPIYIGLWLLFLWLGGHYSSHKNKWASFLHVFAGTIFILIIYALLPEYLRTSRAIIIFGTLTVMLVTWLTSALYRLMFENPKHASKTFPIAIVATKVNGQKLSQILKNANYDEQNFYYIFPGEFNDDIWFTNTISSLSRVVKALGIKEVIYASDDLSMKEIIQSMTQLESRVTFRIAGDDSLSIIGSSDKNQQGELISLDVNYNLSSSMVKRYKRLFDVMVALIIIPFLPIIWVLTGLKNNVFFNTYQVLVGTYTWVGYGGTSADFGFLPELPQGIIKYPISEKLLSYKEDHFKKMNIEYAKDYSFMKDINVLCHNIYKMGNKI